MSTFDSKQIQKIKTLADLKKSGYVSKSIKDELRDNLISKLEKGENALPGILGYEETVVPEMESAILAGHNINLLGLRGQAKTRMARGLTYLLDEYIPYIEGSELHDDPFRPLSIFGKEQIEQHGDATPIAWMHQSDRYIEKLATPDVTVSDLIGDVDPIKAANLKLSYSDEKVIHFGLIPRSNRCIFVINELPDLQPRIQVALFNILQEGDIQIRGFQLRLPLEIQFVFTANPEDYTNRGSIVTPLKDRIESQIITHYPDSTEISQKITQQEAAITDSQRKKIEINDFAKELIEQIAFEARDSEYVDEKSGVSARLTISAYELLNSFAERRTIINKEKNTHIRVSDFWGIVPAITGKIELVYEGEVEGPGIVAELLIGKAVRTLFNKYFPNPERSKKNPDGNPYEKILDHFSDGTEIDFMFKQSQKEYKKTLEEIKGLPEFVEGLHPDQDKSVKYFLMEFVLHGLSEMSKLSKNKLKEGPAGLKFKDLLSGMFNMRMDEFEGGEE